MNLSQRLATAALAGAMGLSFVAPRPALADGAASTRNILFGAAAIGGTLLILNHNKKVHQKYAEYDQRQAQTQAQANQAEAAYQSERQAYAHEAALVGEYQKEVSYQHQVVHAKDKQIASLEHSLQVAKASGRSGGTTAFVRPTVVRSAPSAAVASRSAVAGSGAQVVSYGWGSY